MSGDKAIEQPPAVSVGSSDGFGDLVARLREDANWWDKWGKGAINKRAIAEVKPDLLRAAADEIERLRVALKAALPVLDEHAEDERSFWGDEDKHGMAREAEQIHEQAKAALSPNVKDHSTDGARDEKKQPTTN